MRKSVSPNFEKEIGSKVTDNSIIHGSFFSPSFQKDHTNSEWKQLQRNCDTIFETFLSNFRYVQIHLVLPINKRVESI